MTSTLAAAASPSSVLPNLPDEIWLNILGRLPLRQKVETGGVCKLFRKLVTSHALTIEPAYPPINIVLKSADGIRNGVVSVGTNQMSGGCDKDETNLKTFPSFSAQRGESIEEAQFETITMNANQARALFSKYLFALTTDVRLRCDNLADTLVCLQALQSYDTDGTLRSRQPPMKIYDLTSNAEFTIEKGFIEQLPARLTGLWLPSASFKYESDGDDAFKLFIEKYSKTLKKFSVRTIHQKHLQLLASSCTNLLYLKVCVEDDPRSGLLYLSSLKNLEHLSINCFSGYNDKGDGDPELWLLFLRALTRLKTLDLGAGFWTLYRSEHSVDAVLMYCSPTLKHLNIFNFPGYLSSVEFESFAELPGLESLGLVINHPHFECESCLELIQLSASLRNIVFWSKDSKSPCSDCILDIVQELNEKAKSNKSGEIFRLGLEMDEDFADDFLENITGNPASNFQILLANRFL